MKGGSGIFKMLKKPPRTNPESAGEVEEGTENGVRAGERKRERGRQVLYLRSGVHSEQGARPTMEDAHVLFDVVADPAEPATAEAQLRLERGVRGDAFPSSVVSFYGVYDGHCGRTAAEICAETVHDLFLNSEQSVHGFFREAFISAFLKTDEVIKASEIRYEGEEKIGGACAACAAVIGRQLWMANVGDCEIVLAVRGDEEQMEALSPTVKHKASDPEEKKRIKECGGHVLWGRVFGDLAVARALGDLDYKHPNSHRDVISAVPHVTNIKLDPDDHPFMILACDGLWDTMDYKEAVRVVEAQLESGNSPEQAAAALVRLAIEERKGSDNTSAIVVVFDWQEPMQGEKAGAGKLRGHPLPPERAKSEERLREQRRRDKAYLEQKTLTTPEEMIKPGEEEEEEAAVLVCSDPRIVTPRDSEPDAAPTPPEPPDGPERGECGREFVSVDLDGDE